MNEFFAYLHCSLSCDELYPLSQAQEFEVFQMQT